MKFTGTNVLVTGASRGIGAEIAKGLAAMGGLLIAIHPFTVITFAIGILSGLFLIRNMIWGVFLGIVT